MQTTSDSPDDKRADARTSIRACPICGKPASQAARPFCSPRCADIDLHRWLSGAYSVPAAPADEEAEPGEDQQS
jgi:endogenous inhibitor of DNA gyrase (YacG/DUF329 family)